MHLRRLQRKEMLKIMTVHWKLSLLFGLLCFYITLKLTYQSESFDLNPVNFALFRDLNNVENKISKSELTKAWQAEFRKKYHFDKVKELHSNAVEKTDELSSLGNSTPTVESRLYHESSAVREESGFNLYRDGGVVKIKKLDERDDHLDKDEQFMDKMKARMANRREHVRQVCDELGIHDAVKDVWSRVVYFEQYNLLFCLVPKTGITNWRKLLHSITDTVEEPHQFHTMEFVNKWEVHSNARRISLLNNKSITKMTVVREPFERTLSAFRNRLGKVPFDGLFRDLSRKIHHRYKTNSTTDTNGFANFDEFVSYLIDTPPDRYDEHWQRYRLLCRPCAVDYDVIGKQETIDEDSRYLLKLIGAPKDAKLRTGYNTRGTPNMVLSYYNSVEPKEKLFKLYDRFKEEYKIFNYSKPTLLP
ncbi:carbohydrate sulfotransferase 11-like [Clavelina lepadiformis]|uniref:carbohydrate sulfotransferase 11-like n=1 Tax=Clavelina lepadiformis TaxID=159417 RepID=UPI004040FF45